MQRNNSSRAGILIAFSMLVLACANTDSENILTSGVAARIDVIAEGDGNSTVSVDLTVGSGFGATDMDLDASDRLTATVGEQTRTLAKHNTLGEIDYSTSFAVDAADTLFTVAFLRDNLQDAPNSTVLLPAPFTLLTPQSNTEFPFDQDIGVTWADAGDGNMAVHESVRCDNKSGGTYFSLSLSKSVGDSGGTSVNVSDLIGENVDRTKPCTATITLTRSRGGNLDPNYGEGGSITARQVRTVNVVITFP